jgi:hypothetical protein
LVFGANAQILDVSPAFPTVNDVVTITYDASEGNGALVGTSTVYAHLGVITSTSTSMTNWQYVQGNWGTADPSVLMTSLGNNLFQITFDMDVFYGFPAGTTVNYMSMVFRNANGSVVGRSANGSDIYYPVYPTNSGFLAQFFNPEGVQTLDIGQQLPVIGKSNQNASLAIKDNGSIIGNVSNAQLINQTITATTSGDHLLELIADNGSETRIDSVNYVVNPSVNYQNPPAGMLNGLNYIDDSTVLLQLVAPEKNHIYVLGDFNDWQAQTAYQMNCSLDSTTWWLQLTNLNSSVQYGYQYLIDNSIKVADPLSYKVADPANDGYINALTYPNPYSYPTGQTTGIVSLFETNPVAFQWQHDNFVRPAKKDLIIYELLVRDFVAKHNYATLLDTLDYLDSLGINALELMPISEFEGNESWGYNPIFHMALDKYYGTPEQLKLLVDACHERGIAVIMDIALNHVYGQNPMVNMYWNATSSQPATSNPWLNATCPHPPYCWGYDLNHEAQATKNYIDRVNNYWLDEFHMDGFRFDYTKGFVNSAANYSTTRIGILKRMADTLWVNHPEAYVILEHWADNAEEIELSNYGMMLWGNLTYEYHQAMKGYASNFSSGIYTNRGWTNPYLVTYSESHDEERGMYECLHFGNTTNTAHDVTNELIALKRSEAAAVMLITTPGPKMIWQFGEVGYDYSINTCTDGVTISNSCRTYNKPIRWNYFTETYRRKLYDVYKASTFLRANYSTFRSLDFQYSLTGTAKKLIFHDPQMDGVVIANFAVVATTPVVGFTQTGWWYEYFTGDSVNVNNVNMTLTLQPSDYRVYTTQRIQKPVIIETASLDEMNHSIDLRVYPIPALEELFVSFYNVDATNITLELYDQMGRIVGSTELLAEPSSDVETILPLADLARGTYVLSVKSGNSIAKTTIVKE